DHAGVPWDKLVPSKLLVAPLVTNPTPWTTGYFMTVENKPIEPSQRLPTNFFVTALREPRDANGSLVSVGLPSEALVATWGLRNVRLIDEILKTRLGVPTLEMCVRKRLQDFCAANHIEM